MASHYGEGAATTTTVTHTPRLESISETTDSINPVPLRDPFASGNASEINSTAVSSSAASIGDDASIKEEAPQLHPRARYFHSRRIKKGEAERSWLKKKDPMEKWVWILPVIGLVIGLGIAGYLIFSGLGKVSYHEYCEILNEDWSEGLDPKKWLKEVEVGGFG